MRAIIFILAILLAPPLLAATLVLRDDNGNTVRIYESPCVHAGTLGLIPPDQRKNFQKAEALIGGQRFYGCWIDDADGDPLVLLEDGRGAAFYRKSFKEDLGI